MARRARRLRPPKPRRLVDPAPPIDVIALIKYLHSTHRVNVAELIQYDELPASYFGEKPEVQARIRGLITLFKKIGHLRRRYLFVLIADAESCPEAYYVRDRLELLEREVAILQNEILALGGNYLHVPPVFVSHIKLLN